MEHAWYIYLVVLAAGALAGVVNTLAGSGSLVSLAVLVFLGLPADVANGTNRVGVIVQCLVGIETLRRGGKLRTKRSLWYIAPALLGAIGGAIIATRMSAEGTETVIGLVMASMLLLLVVSPQKWLKKTSEVTEERPSIGLMAILVVVGAYGGFIQAGVGILLLAALVLGAGYEVVEGNAVKLLISVLFTIAALGVFVLNDQVHWGYGAMMAVGQGLGAWAAARFALESEHAAVWVRRLLIVIVFFSMFEFFGVYDWLWAQLAG